MENITLFQNLFYVCMVISILSFAAAVFFFFFFDIPLVFSMKTGRAKKKSDSKMGNKANSSRLRAAAQGAAIIAEQGKSTGELSRGNAGQVNQATSREQETTILQGDKQTTILRQETTVLKASTRDFPPKATEESLDSGATSLLPKKRPGKAKAPEGVNFVITEKTLFIHTDELI